MRHAIDSIKQNQALRRQRQNRKREGGLFQPGGRQAWVRVERPAPTPADRAAHRQRMAEYRRREQRKWWYTALIFLLIALLAYSV